MVQTLDKPVFARISEIRMRMDRPLMLRSHGREYIFAYRPTVADVSETLERISRYSFYAFEEELRQGYITLPGGHRVGVVGQAVREDNKIRALKHISGLNIRVAHNVKGCADTVLPSLLSGSGPRPFRHTMIISPPGCGKTTLLRDIVRQISDGGLTVGLVDERSEVAGCFRGIAQNDVGCRTDVLDGCPKAEGMVMLLRAMAPDVIAVDELGGERDAQAVEDVLTAGVKMLCTAHGNDLDDVKRNPSLKKLIGRGVFEKYVVLSAPGVIGHVS
jgi:stage III sporulation protein AA